MLTGGGRQKTAGFAPLIVSAGLGMGLAWSQAFALEIQQPTTSPPAASSPATPPTADKTPCTGSNCAPAAPATTPSAPSVATTPTAPSQGPEVAVPDSQLKGSVDVLYDIKKAPPAVAKMRELIVEAAASGDITRLRELMKPGPNQTEVAIGEHPEDPVAELKSLSGDSDGVEILAILLDILSTGFVHVGQGTPDEVYVWPYFAEKPLGNLTSPERVELMRLVTAGDVADMKEFGGYNFYRVGIAPDGTWKFFVAGN